MDGVHIVLSKINLTHIKDQHLKNTILLENVYYVISAWLSY